METLTQATRTPAPATVRFAPISRFVAWLLACDAAYREARKLQDLPDERLEDVGITRAEANRAFYLRYGTRDAAPHMNW